MTSSGVTIPRPRLLAALTAVRSKRAIFLVAQAGYGKSVAVAQCLNSLDVPCITLAPAEARNLSDGWFWEALRAACSGVASEAAPRRAGPEDALEALARLDRHVVLAIDNYEEVERAEDRASGIREFVSGCVRDARLSHVHLLLAGRVPPSFPHMRQVVSGEVDVLGAGELAFTAAEVREYLQRVHGAGLPRGYARKRWRDTRGWPAGLMLTEGQPAGRGETLAPLFQYFREEVLSGLTDELRHFVAEAACFDTLSPDLCRRILHAPDAAALSRELEARALFVERSVRGELRFQPLFREFAQSLVPSPRRVAIQRQAGALLRDQGDLLGSAAHYELAGDWDVLLSLLRTHGPSLLATGRLALLNRILSALAAHRDLPPEVRLLQAEVQMRMGSMEPGASLLAGIEPGDLKESLRPQVSVLRQWQALFESRPADALDIGQQALQGGTASLVQRGQFLRGIAAAHRMLRQAELAEERSHEALTTFQRAHDLAEVGYQKMELGILMFEGCRLEEAARWFREAVETFRKLQRYDYLPAALNHLGHVLAEMDELEEAQEVLLRARSVVADWGDHPVVAETLQNLAMTYRAMRRLHLAEECFREYERVSRRLGYVAGEQSAIIGLAITYAEGGHPAEARSLIEPLRGRCATPTVDMRLLMAELTAAWVSGEDRLVLDLCDRLLLGEPASGSPRYVRTAALFRLAALVRLKAPTPVIHAAASSLIHDAPQLEFQARIHRDVARVAAAGVRTHPDPAVRGSPAWRVASERGAASPLLGDDDGPRRYPLNLDVGALQPALRVRIDGEMYRGAWHSALDLFLYLVHQREGGTAVQIARALWGDRVSEHALQQRFHTMVAALRRVLGEEAITRDSTSRPSRYRLNARIVIDYDAGRFVTLARTVLSSAPDAGQLELLRQARQLRVCPYWPARALRSAWFAAVHDEIERLHLELLDRELRLREAEDSPEIDGIRAARQEVTKQLAAGRRRLRAV